MWLVKSSWCVHCCSIDQVYWVSDRCRSQFALWCFLSEKVVVTVLAVFLSFWSWLPDIPCFHKFERQSCLFGLIMHFLPVDCTWECLIIDFIFFLESCLFMCLSVMRFFWLQVFPFLITVSGWYYHFDVLIFIHLFSSTGLVVVAQVNLSWSVFVSIKLSKIGSFHERLVLATECFFSFDIFEIQNDIFFGLLMRCGFAEGSWVY